MRIQQYDTDRELNKCDVLFLKNIAADVLLSSRDSRIFDKCISMCMDRFMDSWNLVSRTYGNRLQREQNKI
ncbi:hypothetical protein FF38_08815 [Lucilia cuprina]|uniref:Mitochondrial import inner membrane translocase subunit n=1 Tax=Lucilia cuprina TaxID=7375 RepID=A0A0L0BT62_LUCCU|nr:hypothetical protein FF38_08815 [Lucilia cuprina]